MSDVIVHAIGAFVAGGAEKFVTNLAVEIAKNRKVFVIALSCRNDAAGQKMIERLIKNNVPYFVGPAEKVGLKSVLWFSKTLQSVAPDIVHLHTPNTELAFYLSGFFTKRNYVLFRTIHNTRVNFGILSRWAFNHNHPVRSIACGKATYEGYRDILRHDFVVISNGIDLEHPVRTKKLHFEFQDKLGLDPDRTHFVCVGSMAGSSVEVAQKAHDTLIKAWMQESKKGKGELHILGAGNLVGELKELALEDPFIKFEGIKDNVFEWLLGCDVFIMISRYEGLPVAAMEACSTGIPCLFSNIEPLKELGYSNVLWSDVDDTNQISKNIEAMLIDPPLPNMENVHKFRSTYSISGVAQQYIDLYESSV